MLVCVKFVTYQSAFPSLLSSVSSIKKDEWLFGIEEINISGDDR